MDGAEVYLLMIRKSLLPILGEAVAMPFTQQVEILKWDWTLNNQEEVKRREEIDKETEDKARSKRDLALSLKELSFEMKNSDLTESDKAKLESVLNDSTLDTRKRIKQIEELQKNKAQKYVAAVTDAEKQLKRETDKLEAERRGLEQERKAFDADEQKRKDNSLTFSFSKRVDFATPQMLNCMKAGEILPRSVLTVFHRSVNVPLLLTITMKNLRFTKYDLSVEVDDTMADMREDWEAEFSQIDFVYGNRRLAGGPKTVGQALTTQQARVFMMKPRE
jgi:type VI protein secretion system component Hcp